MAGATMEVGDRVPQRVVLQMADVRLTTGVGQHLQHVGLGLGVSRLDVVVHLPRVLALPQRLPLGLDLGRVIASVSGHIWCRRLLREGSAVPPRADDRRLAVSTARPV